MAKAKMMRAKEAIVINVGGSPRQYGKITVRSRRTGEMETIDYTDGDFERHVDYVPEDNGVPYAFKAYEKVPASHPAVKENPGAFVPDDDDE
jgi:hypothetical protein